MCGHQRTGGRTIAHISFIKIQTSPDSGYSCSQKAALLQLQVPYCHGHQAQRAISHPQKQNIKMPGQGRGIMPKRDRSGQKHMQKIPLPRAKERGRASRGSPVGWSVGRSQQGHTQSMLKLFTDTNGSRQQGTK